jgi:hypothetical protein
VNCSWETSRTSSNASSSAGGGLVHGIAVISSVLTNLLILTRLAGFLGVSVASFRVDGQAGRLEERMGMLWLLGGIVGGTISEKRANI